MQTIDEVLRSAILCQRAGDDAQADRLLWTVLDVEPDHPDAWNLLGVLAHRAGRHDIASIFARRAIASRGDIAPYWNNFASTCMALERPEDAIHACETAIALDSSISESHFNLAGAYYHTGRHYDSVRAIRKALELKPDWPRAHLYYSMGLLALGDYENGWYEYGHRFHPETGMVRWADTPIPAWRGEGLLTKTIIVWAEQGSGDVIMGARYLRDLRAMGATVKMVCDASMARLMMTLADEVYLSMAEAGDADYHAPILSLPALLGAIEPEAVDAYLPVKPTYRDNGILHVGICWAGAATHSNNHNRSYDPNLFGCFEMEGVNLTSLQHIEGGTDPISQCKDWADTATIINQLDLVISCDTAVAHLAAAMGIPTWIMLPSRGVDWRWSGCGEESSWYSSVRLFRGGKEGFPKAAAKLKALANKPRLVMQG